MSEGTGLQLRSAKIDQILADINTTEQERFFNSSTHLGTG